MQFITITGRLARDAETRQVGEGQVTSFTLACDQGYGDRKQTNWFRVDAWGKKGAGAAPYLLKGGEVTVVGEFSIGEYDGKPQYNVRATDFTLPARSGGNQDRRSDNLGTSQNRQQTHSGHGGAWDDDDPGVPF